VGLSELLRDLSKKEALAIVEEILNIRGSKNPHEAIRRKIRYKRIKKALMFVHRFFKVGIENWQLYGCKTSFRSLRGVLKNQKLECVNFTKLFNRISNKPVDYIYYVTGMEIRPSGKFPEGVIVKLRQYRYLLANRDLMEKLRKITKKSGDLVLFSEYTIAPYKFNILMKTLKTKVTSAVFMLNPQITGVVGVDEIEVRGSDVINGLYGIMFRLDTMSRSLSIFGPLVRIRLENGLLVDCHGILSAPSLPSIIEFLSHLEGINIARVTK